MKKPDQLRQALETALDGRHHIRAHGDRLDMTVIDCALVASGRPGRGFGYRYTLQIILIDFAGEPEEVTVPLMIWLQRNQHDLVASEDAATKGISLVVKPLGGGKHDILIDLLLTETVRFTPRDTGGYDVTFPPEPMPAVLEEAEPLHAIYLNDVLIMHCDAHPEAGQ